MKKFEREESERFWKLVFPVLFNAEVFKNPREKAEALLNVLAEVAKREGG